MPKPEAGSAKALSNAMKVGSKGFGGNRESLKVSRASKVEVLL